MAPSKRVRVRIGPDDGARLESIAAATTLVTRSAAVRAAVRLAREVADATAGGFTLEARRAGAGPIPFHAPPGPDADAARDRWLELRLTADDVDGLDALVAGGYAPDRSSAVRRAVALLERAISVCGPDGALEAVSAAGQRLTIRVPGLTGSVASPPRAGRPSRGAAASGTALPASVLREVEALAEAEGCGVDAMLADLVRQALSLRGAAEPVGAARAPRPSAAAGVFDFASGDPRDEAGQARRMEPRRPAANLPAVARVEEHAWGLVLVGRDGETEGRVIRPDAVLPLDPEDLEPPSGN